MSIQTFKTFKKVALVLGFLSAMSLPCATGQVPPAQIAGRAALNAKPVSLPHLYWHFLIYQHHLDQLAIEHEKKGKDGSWLRSYLQTKLSMTSEEFQPIRESADRLDSAITALNAKAKADVSALNASRSTEGVSSWNAHHYRHKLKKLTAQREAAINKEIDTLNAALSPEAAQKLQNYIQNTFSKNVSIVHVTPGQGQGRTFGPAATTSKVQP
jgi:DNA-nicking Smr family endonuclease